MDADRELPFAQLYAEWVQTCELSENPCLPAAARRALAVLAEDLRRQLTQHPAVKAAWVRHDHREQQQLWAMERTLRVGT